MEFLQDLDVTAVDGWKFYDVSGFRCSYGMIVRRAAVSSLDIRPFGAGQINI